MPLRIDSVRDRKVHRHLRSAPERRLRRGEALYAAGEAASVVYVVRDGHVRLVLPDGGGRGDRTVALAGPWELFGEEGLLRDRTRRTGAVAGEGSRVAVLEGSPLMTALRTTTWTLPRLLGALQDDLVRAWRPGPGRRGPSFEARVAALLLHLVDRFGTEEPSGTRIPLRLTHAELADLVGGHRSTVTTTLNEWLYRDWLAGGRPYWVVVAPEALRRMASGPPGRGPGSVDPSPSGR